jgi:hypothetical protein
MKITLLIGALAFALSAQSQIIIPPTGMVTENFNSIGSSPTDLPSASWRISAAGAGASAYFTSGTTYITNVASDGSPTTGGVYNWGTSEIDRAVGFMNSAGYGSPNALMARFRNSTGNMISSLTLQFQLERYRINSSSFHLQVSSSLDGITWNDLPAGSVSTGVLLPGSSSYNFATPRTIYKSLNIFAVVTTNTDFYLKWTFFSSTSEGQGIGLDNVRLLVNTTSPAIAATLTDGVTLVKQGDALTYTATISNSGHDASSVQYNAPLDANTTLNGAVKSSALTIDDSYSTAENTAVSDNLLTNDFGLPSKTVVSFGPTETPGLIAAGGAGSTDNGGTIGVSSDGGFTYSPPPGFVGYDRFAYTLHAAENPDDIGIVTIAVGAQPSAGTAESFPGVIGNVPVINAPSLLSNDAGNGLNIIAVNGTNVSAFPLGTTTSHGNLSINADGTFTYNPTAGYKGADNFTYTIDNAFAQAQTVTVTITISGMIWFIDNTAAAGGDGRLQTPFNSIAAFQSSTSSQGDIIFVYSGTSSYTTTGLTLKSDQKLVGAGASQTLGTITGYTVPAYSAILPTTNTVTPTITNNLNGSNTITLANGCTVRGFNITGNNPLHNVYGANVSNTTVMENTLTVSSAEGILLTGNSGNSSITNNNVTATGMGVKITTTTGNILNLNFSNNLLNSGSTGASLDGSGGGTFYITGFGNNTVNYNTAGSGILVNTAIFDVIPAGSFNQVSGGNTSIGSVGNGVGGSGLLLTNVKGDLSFTTLNIYADGGTGLGVTSTGAVDIVNGTGFHVIVNDETNSNIEAVGGPCIDIANASANFLLHSIKSTNSNTTGLSLVNAYGGSGSTLLSVSGNTGMLSNATGSELNINGGSGNLTLAIPITSTVGDLIKISNLGSSTVSLSGSVSGGGAITLSNNSYTTFNFTGGITLGGLSSSFSATGGGTLNITGANNIIGTGTAPNITALTISGVTIGSSGVTFKSISANGSPNGIVLISTGNTAGLTITGSGTAGSGGTIQNTTSQGINISETLNPSFNNMHIYVTAGSGVKGTKVTNFSFTNSVVEYSGFTSTTTPVDGTVIGNIDVGNITFNIGSNGTPAGTENNLAGTVTITNNTLNFGLFTGVDIYNYAGTINNLNVSNNSFTSGMTTGTGGTSYGSAIRVIEYGSSGNSSSITRATIDHNIIVGFPGGGGIQLQGGNQTAGGPGGNFGVANDPNNIVNVTNNIIHGHSSATRMNTNGILFTIGGANPSSRSQGNVYIANNGTSADPIANMTGTGISPNTFGFATVTAVIDNNVIAPNNALSSQGIGGGLSYQVTSADNPQMTLRVTNNTISQTDGYGIWLIERGESGSFNLSVKNNTVAAPLSGIRPGIRFDCGNASGNSTMCLDLSGNSSAGSGGLLYGIGLRKQGTVATTNTFGITGLSPSPATAAQTVTYISGTNPSGGGVYIVSGDNFVSCNTAPIVLSGQSHQNLVQR